LQRLGLVWLGISAEMEEVVDLIMSREEALHLTS
jgi:hypothetical protein